MFWTTLLAAPVLIGASQTPPTPASVLPAPAVANPADPLVVEPGTVSEIVPFIQPFDLDATRRMAVEVMLPSWSIPAPNGR